MPPTTSSTPWPAVKGFGRSTSGSATAFGRAAACAGVGRIVYVGALGNAPSSAHLASRHEVGSALSAAGVPVVELRAAVVFGSGSISFEMLRYLTERLPAMVCPRWVRTRIQPIALVDLLAYLDQSLQVDPGVYEIGGADVTTYRDMISEYARVRGLRRRRIVDIPWLTPHLSSYWVDLVTPVDRSVSHALIESLVTEVVVVDCEAAMRSFSVAPMGVEHALAAALDDQDEEVARSLFSRGNGLVDGVYTVLVDVTVPAGVGDAIAHDLEAIGGSLDWYGAVPGWTIRLILGRLVGETFAGGVRRAWRPAAWSTGGGSCRPGPAAGIALRRVVSGRGLVGVPGRRRIPAPGRCLPSPRHSRPRVLEVARTDPSRGVRSDGPPPSAAGLRHAVTAAPQGVGRTGTEGARSIRI